MHSQKTLQHTVDGARVCACARKRSGDSARSCITHALHRDERRAATVFCARPRAGAPWLHQCYKHRFAGLAVRGMFTVRGGWR